MLSKKSIIQTKILDAAEIEFGSHSFESSSLRRITKSAGVNLAAANYHFGSKEALYGEVLLRRVQPINRRRLELLDQAILAHGKEPIPLETALDAFVRPVFETLGTEKGGESFLRILSRSFHGHHAFVRELLAREFDPIVKRFMQELRRTLPAESAENLLWGFLLSTGAMLFVAAHQSDLESITHGVCRASDFDRIVARIVGFATRGLTPPTAHTEAIHP